MSLFSGPLKEYTGNVSGQRDWYCEVVQGDERMYNTGSCYSAFQGKHFQHSLVLCRLVPDMNKCQNFVSFEDKSQTQKTDMVNEQVKENNQDKESWVLITVEVPGGKKACTSAYV